jgi:hypothetical protein
LLVAASKGEIQYQLGRAIDSDKGIGTADGCIVFFLSPLVLFLLPYKSPYLIALNILYGNVHDQPTHQFLAFLASMNQQPKNRIAMKAGDPFRRADTRSFHEQLQGKDGLIHRDRHAAQGPIAILGVGLAAFRTTEPLEAIPVLSESTARGIAGCAVHRVLLTLRIHSTTIQQALAVVKCLIG